LRRNVADVVDHSDHLLWLACTLVQHGETPSEREDAWIPLVVLMQIIRARQLAPIRSGGSAESARHT
jgi:hypothetical protein